MHLQTMWSVKWIIYTINWSGPPPPNQVLKCHCVLVQQIRSFSVATGGLLGYFALMMNEGSSC